jgi:hypothetical protein
MRTHRIHQGRRQRIDPLAEDRAQLAAEPGAACAEDKVAEHTGFTPSTVEGVHCLHHRIQPAPRRARGAQRVKDALPELGFDVFQHRTHHVVLPLGEIVVQARLPEPGDLGELGQGRTVVPVAPDGEHQPLDASSRESKGEGPWIPSVRARRSPVPLSPM